MPKNFIGLAFCTKVPIVTKPNKKIVSIGTRHSQPRRRPRSLDQNKELHCYLKPMGIPLANLIDENMELLTYEHVGIAGAFEKLLELFPEEE